LEYILWDGLRIYTTIDSRICNRMPEDAVAEHYETITGQFFHQNTPDRIKQAPFIEEKVPAGNRSDHGEGYKILHIVAYLEDSREK